MTLPDSYSQLVTLQPRTQVPVLQERGNGGTPKHTFLLLVMRRYRGDEQGGCGRRAGTAFKALMALGT